jgi:hypothetical protein
MLNVSEALDPKGFIPLFPFPPQNAVSLRKILTEDWIYRKRQRWPLVPLEDFKYYFSVVSANTNPIRDDDAFVVGSIDYRRLSTEDAKRTVMSKLTNWNAAEAMSQSFILLKPLFEKYKGKIAVCGGAVLRRLLSLARSDCDIFFYGVSEQEATNILCDCIAIIVSQANQIAREDEPRWSIRIQHKLYVTNVILFDSHGSEETYQFIHRVYPTLDSIIGGFDLGPSMLAFDGEHIFGTPLGAFCVAKQCVIVDTSRRSISFEQRIYKYCTFGFNVIFPGITRKQRETLPSFQQSPANPGARKREGQLFMRLIQKMGYDLFLDDYSNHPSYSDAIYREGRFEFGFLKIISDGHQNKSDRFVRPRPLYATDEDLPRNLLFRYSDYADLKTVGYTFDNEAKVNGALLRTENLEGVSVSLHYDETVNPTYEEAFRELIDLLSEPILEYDLDSYRARLYKYLYKREQKLGEKKRFNRSLRRETPLFAEFALKVRRLQDDAPDMVVDYVNSVVNFLVNRMKANAKKCQETLVGIKWMTQAVGVQWTSSINPIMKNSRDFYGEYYTPFWIGIPCEVETTLRLFRLRRGNYFYRLPKDVFNLLLSYILRVYIYNTSWYDLYLESQPKSQNIHQPFSTEQIKQAMKRANIENKEKYGLLLASNGGKSSFEGGENNTLGLRLPQNFPPGFQQPLMLPPPNYQYPGGLILGLPPVTLPAPTNYPYPANDNQEESEEYSDEEE